MTKDRLEELKEKFGKPIVFDEEELDGMSEQSLRHASFYTRMHESVLDETTKSDINFSVLFSKMNQTYSSLGEEYLYYVLSNPCMEYQVLQEREKEITYFQKNVEQATRMQVLFSKIGKNAEVSLFQYLEFSKTVDGKNLKKHLLSLVAFVITGVVSVIRPQLGLVPFFLVIIVNVVTYWSNRQFAYAIMGSIRQLEAMINAAEELSRWKDPVLTKYQDRLKNAKRYKKVLKNSDIIFTSKASFTADADAFLDYLRMLSHFDYVKLSRILERIQSGYDELYEIAEIVGKIESMIAIASYRESLPYYAIPELMESGKDIGGKLKIVDAYHPLLEDPVTNTLETSRGILLTGSNASGKSTFLRTIAINAILAQTIHTCCAKEYASGFYHIRSAMSLRDSLANGESYFVVEIETMREILEESKRYPIMCFVDEILRGTNTIERIAAATEILRYMKEQGIFCFAASHDMELTKLLKKEYDLYHFQEYMEEGNVTFDYILYPGPVTTRNAIRLLEMKAYDKSIIAHAMALVDYFEVHGEWPFDNNLT